MLMLRRLTWVELKLFSREPFSLIFTFAFPIVVLVVLIGSFGTSATAQGFSGIRPSDYYLATYAGVVIAAIGLAAIPVHVAAYRERAILRRFSASGIPIAHSLGAQALVGLVMALVGAAVLMVVGRLAYHAAWPKQPLLVLADFVLGTLSFLALGFLIAGVTRNARSAQAVGMVLFFPMWLLSGAGPPPAVMGAGLRTASAYIPLTYVVRAIQSPWLSHPLRPLDLAVPAAILAVAGLGSARLLRDA